MFDDWSRGADPKANPCLHATPGRIITPISVDLSIWRQNIRRFNTRHALSPIVSSGEAQLNIDLPHFVAMNHASCDEVRHDTRGSDVVIPLRRRAVRSTAGVVESAQESFLRLIKLVLAVSEPVIRRYSVTQPLAPRNTRGAVHPARSWRAPPPLCTSDRVIWSGA
jgi:hypothetical protein